MIRDNAAREVARMLLGPLVAESDKSEMLIDLGASMIVNAVKADEMRQEIEALETPSTSAKNSG